MRVELTRRVFGLGGRRITDAEARLNWDVGLGVIVCFATILAIVIAWEPHFSWLIFGKVVLCAGLVLICVSVAFERPSDTRCCSLLRSDALGGWSFRNEKSLCWRSRIPLLCGRADCICHA